MVMIILLGSLFVTIGSVAMAVQNPDQGYIIVKCTVTLSVDVGNDDNADITYTVHLGTHAPGTNLLSGPIPVENDGQGSIVIFNVQRTECYRNRQEDGGGDWESDTGPNAWQWQTTFGAATGPLKACFGVIFSSTTPTDYSWVGDDDVVESQKTYSASANSILTGPHSPYDSAISGTEYNFVSYQEIRNMYVRVKLPDAVADQKPRRITVQVTAAMGF